MKKIGYIRTSTGEQTGAAQRQALSDFGCDEIYHDRGVSGGAVIRPQLERAIAACAPGDTIVVGSFDRLARSLLFLIEAIERLRTLEIDFISLREQIDTTTPGGKLHLHMIGAFAEFERAMIRERTTAGLAAAKAKGVKLGRKTTITPERWEEFRGLLDAGRSVTEVARIGGVSRQAIYRMMKQQEHFDADP